MVPKAGSWAHVFKYKHEAEKANCKQPKALNSQSLPPVTISYVKTIPPKPHQIVSPMRDQVFKYWACGDIPVQTTEKLLGMWTVKVVLMKVSMEIWSLQGTQMKSTFVTMWQRTGKRIIHAPTLGWRSNLKLIHSFSHWGSFKEENKQTWMLQTYHQLSLAGPKERQKQKELRQT